ncbi:CLUMA_CG013851, isoform A [Clunio marinus]|uniref:CLUMA_CG013851, isoform A n=1 Tax=Clunio marinus TaxID=568069 RepID=A0A1J1IK27_9DIPT|nr:CLUMA_CG013851, isoform A [Clunio marinus]
MEMVITAKEEDEEQIEFQEPLIGTELLSADHPLLERFQKALKEHLLKVKNELEEEIVDLDNSIQEKDLEIEEVGSKLFDLNKEIEGQRDQLDKYSKQILDMSDKRKTNEEKAARLKAEANNKEASCKDLKRMINEISQEIASMRVLESEITKWNDEIQSEIALAKRIVSKDSKDKILASEEKKKMDLILFKLDSEVRKNETQLSNIEDQIREHNDSIASLNKSLADANVDLEGLQQEQKKLMQAWGEIIIAVQHRDKILSKTKTELFKEQEEHKLLQASIETTKKFVMKELETSEKLNEFKDRMMLQISESENIKLEQKLDHFKSILEKTESDIEQARSEGLLTKNHVTKLSNKLEKLNREKLEMEEKILDLLQDQVTTDKAGQHRGVLLRNTQEERRKLEIIMAQTENQLSLTILDLEKWRGNVQKAKEHVDQMQKEHNEADLEANNVNEEIEKLKVATKNKMVMLDSLHKQLEQMIENLGGKEMSLKEAQVIDLEKKIAELNVSIKESQQFWLRIQSMVAELSEKRAQQMDEIFIGRKQLMVVEQKALKVEAELEQSQMEQKEINRSLSILNNKLDQASVKLYEKRKMHEKGAVECEIAHKETINKLKDAEMDVLRLEQDITELGREIEEFKQEMTDKHNEALSWETKVKMASEAKKLQDDELAKSSEIGIMKAEIHRMEVKYAQLKKIQEKMVQALENSVYHRDHIHDAAKVREKKTGTKNKTQSNIKHKLNEMMNKLKIIKIELKTNQKQFTEFQAREQEIKDKIAAKEQDIQREKMQDCLLQTEIEQSLLLKQKNLENIVKRQKRTKSYKTLQTCTYLPKLKAATVMDAELQRQTEIHQHLLEILESLQRDFPAHKFPIEKILQTLRN